MMNKRGFEPGSPGPMTNALPIKLPLDLIPLFDFMVLK